VKQLLFDSRIALSAGAAGALAILAVWVVMRRRLTPDEKERRRRMAVNEHRRTIEGFLTEASENQLFYHYELAGVEYSTSQDISAIRSVLPADLSRLVGPVSVKYDPRNPANSIIICEDWSGMASIVDAADNQLRKEEPACN
jgi:hypothetical protein